MLGSRSVVADVLRAASTPTNYEGTSEPRPRHRLTLAFPHIRTPCLLTVRRDSLPRSPVGHRKLGVPNKIPGQRQVSGR
ncbi:hypothetical protein N7510_004141 [Penicillium lagena]|uniref:uncharacterized protein n=1 Tax=Penicillium lagena TaxID=94218 RepID=UPI00253FA543|nr:uncharacterized protein N7510_004141 [Penicillium lagena]KAJ5620157.1 hypothetical protein N7510_004141 [Penicillium lagena]